MHGYGRPRGEPDLRLAGLEVWVHGRECEDQTDFWDGNWLRVTARCRADGANVLTAGPILRVDELVRWVGQVEALGRGLSGTAVLEPMEPALRVELIAQAAGRMEMRVEISPNPVEQRHSFSFALDQSFLPPLLADVRRILQRFPLRGSTEEP